MNWFYAKDGSPAGPVDEEEFERLTATGVVGDTTLVWHNGLAEWKPYGTIRPSAVPPPPPLPASTAAAEAMSEPDEIERPHGVAESEAPRYAGFWIRAAAILFDTLILLPVFTVLTVGFFVAFTDFLTLTPAGANARTLFELVVLAIASFYHTWFVGRFAATPGKMICHLRVVRSDGTPVHYGRALARFFSQSLSSLLYGAGYIMAGFNAQKCTLHDLLCDTRVLHAD